MASVDRTSLGVFFLNPGAVGGWDTLWGISPNHWVSVDVQPVTPSSRVKVTDQISKYGTQWISREWWVKNDGNYPLRFQANMVKII